MDTDMDRDTDADGERDRQTHRRLPHETQLKETVQEQGGIL